MGKKLIRRVPIEQENNNSRAKGHYTIVLAQHLLLYGSGYVLASTAYLIHGGSFTRDLLPTAVILMFAVCACGI
jgi:hypothetical protein